MARLIATVAVLLGILATPAEASVDTWPVMHMTSTVACVRADFVVTGSGWKVHRAMRTWNEAQTMVRFTTQQEPGCVPVRIHQYDAEDARGGYTSYPYPSEFTTDGRSWLYSEVDIYLNRYYQAWRWKSKSRTIVAHELGHVLGLGHNDSKRSVMSYDYNLTRWQGKSLNPIDVRNLTALYTTTVADRRKAGQP